MLNKSNHQEFPTQNKPNTQHEFAQKYIATTRFNNETWNENQEFIKKHNQTAKKQIKCIYPVSHINQQLPQNTIFYVLEMNNEVNKIMGIGLIKNIPIYKKYNVYKNTKYNEYAYIGYHRIDRKDMNELEETIMKVFDYYCFKGRTHLKRLKGLKIFPQKILDKCHSILDLLEFITNIYKSSRKPTVSPEAPEAPSLFLERPKGAIYNIV